MSIKKIVVPEGMLEACENAIESNDGPGFKHWDWAGCEETMLPVVLEAALLWLSENPIVPTGRQLQDMSDELKEQGDFFQSTETYCAEWQRRAFLAPEPEVSEEIKDLLFDWDYRPLVTKGSMSALKKPSAVERIQNEIRRLF